MGLLDILKFPDPRLRKKSVAVDEVTEELKSFTQDMLETMYQHKGIGLSAPQVNKHIRYLCTDTRRPDSEEAEEEARYDLSDGMTELEKKVPQPLHMFNPVITKKEGKITYDEGCLSVPTYFETVERYNYIEVEGLDENGNKIVVKTDGLLSICIQHEIDHLDGKLFIDRLSTIKSNRIKSKIKKFGYPEAQQQEEPVLEEE